MKAGDTKFIVLRTEVVPWEDLAGIVRRAWHLPTRRKPKRMAVLPSGGIEVYFDDIRGRADAGGGQRGEDKQGRGSIELLVAPASHSLCIVRWLSYASVRLCP